MARSLRSNAAQANKKLLREKVYSPHEIARLERLSAKLKGITALPKPEHKLKDEGAKDTESDDVAMAEDCASSKNAAQELGTKMDIAPQPVAERKSADVATNSADTNVNFDSKPSPRHAKKRKGRSERKNSTVFPSMARKSGVRKSRRR